MKFYHATPEAANVTSIIMNGFKPGRDDAVHFADNAKGASEFLAIRGQTENYVMEVILRPDYIPLVEESFDHNEDFFGCRVFLIDGEIPPEAFEVRKVQTMCWAAA